MSLKCKFIFIYNFTHTNYDTNYDVLKRSFHCVFYLAQVSCSTKANTTQRPIDQNKRNNKRMALDDITNSADKEGLYTTTPRTPKRRCVSSKCSLRHYVSVFKGISMIFYTDIDD